MARAKKDIKKSEKQRRTEISIMRRLCSSLAPRNEPTFSERIHLSNGVFLYSEGHLVII